MKKKVVMNKFFTDVRLVELAVNRVAMKKRTKGKNRKGC